MFVFHKKEELPRLTYGENERPKYAFCEASTVTTASPWHIRPVPEGILKLGGGITTSSLCGRVKGIHESRNGWDLRVRITDEHLTHCCQTCAEIYRGLPDK